MKFPFVSRKRFERALQNARSAELERDKALEISELDRLIEQKQSDPIAVVRNQLEWAEFCASATFRRMQQEDYAIITSHQHEEEWDIVGYSIPTGSNGDSVPGWRRVLRARLRGENSDCRSDRGHRARHQQAEAPAQGREVPRHALGAPTPRRDRRQLRGVARSLRARQREAGRDGLIPALPAITGMIRASSA